MRSLQPSLRIVAARIIALGTALWSGSAVAAPKELPGFPVNTGGANGSAGITVTDMDGDGKPEIITVVGEGVGVTGADGKMWAGFPVGLKTASEKSKLNFKAAPTVCDLDGDGRKEIIVGGSNKRLFAVRTDGKDAAGFPVPLPGHPRGAVACFGSGSGRLATLYLTVDTGALLEVAGTGGAPKTLAKVGKGAESGIAIADLDGDRKPELIVGGGDAKLHVLSAQGKSRKGFPYKMTFRISGVPAVGDIDDDGRPDVVFGSQDFKIHAVDIDGKALAGFPVDTEYRIYAGVALADMTGDGVLDVVVGSADSKVYAVTGKGKPLRGFPVKLDDRIVSAMVAADFDKDGKAEVAATTQGGSLHVLTAAGKRLSGFPARLGGKVEIAPAVADLNGDGMPELVAQAPKGKLHAYTFKARGKAERALVWWGGVGHNAAHDGRYSPNPGRFKGLGFNRKSATTVDALQAQFKFFDLDGDPEGETQVRWYANGRRQADLDNVREVPASRTRKHQKWHFTLQASANFAAYGEKGQLTRTFQSRTIEVKNTPPGRAEIDFGPKPARTTSKLEVKVVTPSADPDGDKIEYRHIWLQDQKPLKLRTTTASIDARKTRKNEEWRVVVVPFDGEVEGTRNAQSMIIQNTPPGPAKISVSPAAVRIQDRVQVEVTTPGADDDRDPVTYDYQYWVDGQPLDLAASSAVIPPGTLRKHTTVKVRVTSVDDEEKGAHVEAQFEILNTPPPPPQLAIWPAKPGTEQNLTLGVVGPNADPDGDPIVLKHAWTVDGQPAQHPTTVPASATKKGQLWTLTVTPFDGEIDGKPVSVQTRIENTPPTAPLVVLADYVPFTDTEVKPQIQNPATDADGDAIRLKYRWTRDGKPAGFPESKASLLPADTRKNQAWKLEVIPNDGTADGRSSTLSFSIRNSAPIAPKISVTHKSPTTRDRQEIKIVQAATDKDGDALKYRYRWFRNGKAVKAFANTKTRLEPGEAKKGQHWRVEVRAFDGDEEGQTGLVEFRVRNHEPDAPQVSLLPARPTTDQPLVCKPKVPATDPDGDAVTYRTHWYTDGKPVSLSPDLDTLSPSMTREKQRWQCEVEAFDGRSASKKVRSAEVVVVNSPPKAPKVSVVPKVPTTNRDLVCQLDAPAQDLDLDKLTYSYSWRVNGKLLKDGSNNQNRVSSGSTKRGQKWECEVTPSDGESKGPAARGSVKIQNSKPTAPRVSIEPARPRQGDKLKCKVTRPSEDADKDRIKYSYAWSKDGVPQDFAKSSTEVPGRLVKARDLWKCSVTPSDGTAEGESAASVDVVIGAK